LVLYDQSGNGWNYCSSGASATLTDPNGNVVVSMSANCCWQEKDYPFTMSPQGCTDPAANNYDANAVCEDGSCCYVTPFVLDIYTDYWCGNESYMGWAIEDDNGNTIASGGNQTGESYSSYTNYYYDICLTDSCAIYNLVLYDQNGSGWGYCSSGAYATLTDPNGNVIVSFNNANCCWNEKVLPFSMSTQGCTDPVANNYDANAVCEDGSCCYVTPYVLDIYTDDWCGNASYMGWAVQDNNGNTIASGGSQAGEDYADYTNYYYDICIDTGSCAAYNLILYDQSNNGWNYCSSGASATLTDPNGNVIVSMTANCCWSQQSYPFGSTLTQGCMDATANNYDANAVCDDGSCCYVAPFTLEINTDNWCGNASYMGWAVEDDNGNTIASGGNQAGESYTDNTTYNYDICISDSCVIYNLVLYDQSGNGWNYCSSGASAILTDPNGNEIVNMTANCCWNEKVFAFSASPQGCMDPIATNYDPNAVCEDSSCCYGGTAFNLNINTNNQCGSASRLGWEIEDDNGNIIASGGNQANENYTDNANYNYDFCITDSCATYNLILYDDYGSGWSYCSQAEAILTDANGNAVVSLTNYTGSWSDNSFSFNSSIQGCMDPTATNYDASAACDDGSCCYGGTAFNLEIYTADWCG
ncbi:MAG: hypothetical protein ACKVJA_05945, partial [Flavobacteriales bacterium]